MSTLASPGYGASGSLPVRSAPCPSALEIVMRYLALAEAAAREAEA